MVTTKVWEASQIYGFEKLYWKNLKEIKICVLKYLTFDLNPTKKEQEKNFISSLKEEPKNSNWGLHRNLKSEHKTISVLIYCAYIKGFFLLGGESPVSGS